MATIKRDLQVAATELQSAVMGELNAIFGSAADKLEVDVARIAQRMAVAARRQDSKQGDALRAECADQLELLIVEAELEALQGRDNLLDHFFQITFGSLVAVAAGGLRSITAVP